MRTFTWRIVAGIWRIMGTSPSPNPGFGSAAFGNDSFGG